ncbi:unnamed protein product [Candidula unifasciata]|uniref:Protein kinase domain-containing protein n=1 Tax=Candidula unifasciata TaxID=100452 RepID=A0A8S3YUM6_9EUPU|nr:unnamed protein product [Candidula unifasciata]
MEEKLDFFSEVDMMKCFKHENIVLLLGVCTRKEPIYAVMEFLLHGDLKTYLLSRRSLVGQGVKEAEDVKAENLTQMAVDVAQGLSYLHCLKYVHRDLACRNCLVHANKTVKIGDFGMTRHVSSVDYYRFSRKGMLPVRWTAPEALKDGIYSAKSDIWSYGVLVFEIVTFGSFPYQGLSNKEVIDYVSKGNQLMLPDKCPGALKSFIHWCMSVDPGYRPDLDDILSYLNYSPAFLTPCLDVPTTSVVHEDTDSLEIRLPVSASQNTAAPGPPISLHHSSQRNHGWQGKLKYKRKTFSVPGLVSFGKSSKSSLVNRSPVSLSRSSSLCSATLHSSSLCGLPSCGIRGGWGLGESLDEGIDDRGDRLKNEIMGLKEHETPKPDRKSERREVICNVEIDVHNVEHRASIEFDHIRYSSTAGSDKGELSSGYVSQNSKGESKQICQTVTSL